MEQRGGLGVIVTGVIVAVGLFFWAGGAWFPRAQYEAARAVRLNAESLNVLARAGAGAIRADTAQSWLLPMGLLALVVILVVRDRQRQAQTERLIVAIAEIITPQLSPPYLTLDEARGKLRNYEEVLK